jgi:RNA polymerase sigma-70 factor (ECF subfamily)
MDLAAASLRLILPEGELSVTPSDPPRPTPQPFGEQYGLWEENAAQLAGLIRAMGIPAHRADDLLQELYLQAIGFLATVESPDEARRWLLTVATNRCRLEHRQQSRWRRLVEGFAIWRGAEKHDAVVEDQERTAEIDAALDRLKPTEREAIVLRYFCNLNSREISEVLAMPEATVRSHLAKARRQLARDLADWNDG